MAGFPEWVSLKILCSCQGLALYQIIGIKSNTFSEKDRQSVSTDNVAVIYRTISFVRCIAKIGREKGGLAEVNAEKKKKTCLPFLMPRFFWG